jgi:hypothetical protein
MRRKKWLWISFAALCAFAVAIGWLGRSGNDYELDALRSLHPLAVHETHEAGKRVTRFDFKLTRDEVLRRAPFLKKATVMGMSSGRMIEPMTLESGMSCDIQSYYPSITTLWLSDGPPQPWYSRAWLTLKHRVGLE